MDIVSVWKKFEKLPFGKKLFKLFVKRNIPYTGSICPTLLSLEPGRALVEMKDRKAFRNHLSSLHAAALMNLGEFASGLALVSSLKDNQRAILKKFEIEYFKKARGTVTAEGLFSEKLENLNQEQECWAHAKIKDASGEVTTTVRALWKIGPKK